MKEGQGEEGLEEKGLGMGREAVFPGIGIVGKQRRVEDK